MPSIVIVTMTVIVVQWRRSGDYNCTFYCTAIVSIVTLCVVQTSSNIDAKIY